MGDDSTDDPITARRNGKRHPLLLPEGSLGRQGIQCSDGKNPGYLDAACSRRVRACDRSIALPACGLCITMARCCFCMVASTVSSSSSNEVRFSASGCCPTYIIMRNGDRMRSLSFLYHGRLIHCSRVNSNALVVSQVNSSSMR